MLRRLAGLFAPKKVDSPFEKEKPAKKAPTAKMIHEAFLKKSEYLTEWCLAKEDIKSSPKQQKAERLQRLGFSSAEGIGPAIAESGRVTRDNERRDKLKDAVEYFDKKYPEHFLFTFDSITDLCEEFELACGDVCNYTGNVPLENIDDMERLKVDDEDRVYHIGYISTRSRATGNYTPHYTPISYGHMMSVLEDYDVNEYMPTPPTNIDLFHKTMGMDSLIRIKEEQLLIVAPYEQFTPTIGVLYDSYTQRAVKYGRETKSSNVKDPLVLHPVKYTGEIYYLLVTSWE